VTHANSPSPDVLFCANVSPSIFRQTLRVAVLCRELGLDVQFIGDDFDEPAIRFAAICRRESFPVIEFPARTWRNGPLAYPSAPALLRLEHGLRRSLEGFRPAVLVTHTDGWGVWRVLHAWAQRVGVVGVVLQEGMCASMRPGFVSNPTTGLRRPASRLIRTFGPRMIRDGKRIYEFATQALVWGEAMREHLLARGRTPETIHVVGGPAFDHIEERMALTPRERRTILFAQQPQPNVEIEREACRHIVATCAGRLGCKLLFRPHPRGDLDRETIVEMAGATRMPELVEVVDSGDVVDHLHRASVFVTYYSTSAYHAAIAGLPLVLADWVSPMYELDAPRFGAGLSAKTPDELEPALKSALDDSACRSSLHDGAGAWLGYHLGEFDGGAARRSASVIASLVNRHRDGSKGPDKLFFGAMKMRSE